MYGHPVELHPIQSLKYVLWDPEVESYTYELANVRPAAEFLAPLLGVSDEQVLSWFDEANHDAYLTRDRGFHWSCKRRLQLGNRLVWYAITRATKPSVIVEAGVHEGLSSEMFLCALRRNAVEGSPGRLISFDIFEDTGWLVHPDLRRNWQLIHGSTLTDMAPALEGTEVDLFVHDTLHTEETIAAELNAVLQHAAPRLTVIDGSGLVRPTLRQFCDRHETNHHYFCDYPRRHFVRPHGTGLAFFDRTRVKAPSIAYAAA